MEDTLRVKKSSGRRSKNRVLILVLMEDTLRDMIVGRTQRIQEES